MDLPVPDWHPLQLERRLLSVHMLIYLLRLVLALRMALYMNHPRLHTKTLLKNHTRITVPSVLIVSILIAWPIISIYFIHVTRSFSSQIFRGFSLSTLRQSPVAVHWQTRHRLSSFIIEAKKSNVMPPYHICI